MKVSFVLDRFGQMAMEVVWSVNRIKNPACFAYVTDGRGEKGKGGRREEGTGMGNSVEDDRVPF